MDNSLRLFVTHYFDYCTGDSKILFGLTDKNEMLKIINERKDGSRVGFSWYNNPPLIWFTIKPVGNGSWLTSKNVNYGGENYEDPHISLHFWAKYVGITRN